MSFLSEWVKTTLDLGRVLLCIAFIGLGLLIVALTFDYSFRVSDSYIPKIIWSVCMFLGFTAGMTFVGRIPGSVNRL